ncbi:MAG: hypothetical protein P8N94_07805 [Gammaproteobacteria bacterium]|nr:hypothetical protein [Gammaproteobacteria bacterium]MDG2337880.1 hypothetical protein [Gammaproteobacteria bacterium]
MKRMYFGLCSGFTYGLAEKAPHWIYKANAVIFVSENDAPPGSMVAKPTNGLPLSVFAGLATI